MFHSIGVTVIDLVASCAGVPFSWRYEDQGLPFVLVFHSIGVLTIDLVASRTGVRSIGMVKSIEKMRIVQVFHSIGVSMIEFAASHACSFKMAP